MFESEREAIFKKSWQCVAPAGEPARPGDFAVAPVGDFAVLVTRGRAGELRAFRNTCQRYLKATPQEIRAKGGAGFVVNEFLKSVGRG